MLEASPVRPLWSPFDARALLRTHMLNDQPATTASQERVGDGENQEPRRRQATPRSQSSASASLCPGTFTTQQLGSLAVSAIAETNSAVGISVCLGFFER